MKGLREDEFEYDQFVTDFNTDDNCGTVCCVAGWLPKWFSKDFKWIRQEDFTNGKFDYFPELRNSGCNLPSTQLEVFFGLEEGYISTLFYGSPLIINHKVVMDNSIGNNLSEVIALWERTIELIENDVIEVE